MVMRNRAKELNVELLEEIVERILKVTQPEKIILFGSYARGGYERRKVILIQLFQLGD